MEIKKNTRATLENYSKLFLSLGLFWALLITFLAIEYKNERPNNFAFAEYNSHLTENDIHVPITTVIKPLTTPKQEIILDNINKVIDNSDLQESTIKPTDFNFDDPVEKGNFNALHEVKIVDPGEEDVPFILIEEAPTFPGCTGSKIEKKECFSAKISKFVAKEFNAELGQTLGLSTGKQRIIVLFTINKNGDITDIQARAPHVRLEKEAIRIVSLLPKMTPGKQRDRAVNVKYSLPISFNVE